MRSPICYLENQIPSFLFASAPEKAFLCEEYLDKFSITFALVDEKKFGVRVKLKEESSPEVQLPIAALEYLWAFSHYSWVLTQEYAKTQASGASQFNCIGNKRLNESFILLDWAKKNLADSGVDPWPKTGPRPRYALESQDEDEKVASELFLCSLAWILHHEIGHVVLNHPFINTSLSATEEMEADDFATKWLLGGLDENDPRLKKRAIGIAIAVLCIQSLEVKSVTCLNNTHPAPYDRIFKNTSSYKCGNDEVVEAICTVVLQYLFHDAGIVANVNGAAFSGILGDLLYDISREKSS